MMSDFARVEHRPSLVLAGLRETIDPAVGNADVWERVLNTVKLAGFSTEGTQQVSIIFGANMRQEFDYMAGLVVNSRDNAQALGLNAAEVPAGDYAIVDVRGPAPLASMTGLDYLLGTFLPERALTASGPAMEVYGPGDTSSEDYMMQVWVPVKAL